MRFCRFGGGGSAFHKRNPLILVFADARCVDAGGNKRATIVPFLQLHANLCEGVDPTLFRHLCREFSAGSRVYEIEPKEAQYSGEELRLLHLAHMTFCHEHVGDPARSCRFRPAFRFTYGLEEV